MSLSREQKMDLKEDIENPTIIRKIDNNEYSRLTRKEWAEIFHSIDANIEYFAKYGNNDDAEDWYRDLYNDAENLMKQSHPEWQSLSTKEVKELRKHDNPCGPGQIYVPGYHKRDGKYVTGYCRRQ